MDLKKRLLDYYSLSDEFFLEYTRDIKDIIIDNSKEFYDLEDTTLFLKDCIKNKQKIMVYGDYDADGIMACSIIVKTLKMLGSDVGYYIPSRSIDGYGITLKRAEQIKKKGYDVLITVDNGVKQFEALNYLKTNNVKIVLTDHHVYDKIPDVDFFIHPHNKNNPEDNCGAYVAFMLSISLLGYIDFELLAYAALATISDMMPMNNIHNRNIVRVALEYLKKHEEHPFHLLSKSSIDETTFGYVIAPKINAYGRIIEDISINKLIKMFVDSNLSEREFYADLLERINLKRKQILNESEKDTIVYEDHGIIAINERMIDGLIGLLAAKMLHEYNKPSIAFNLREDVLKGSARSLNGCDLSLFFEKNQDILLSSGGHALAGGLSIKKESFDLFKTRFEDFVKSHPVIEKEVKYIDLEINDINIQNYMILKMFSPFGLNFEEPLFSIKLSKEKLFFYNNHVKAFLNGESSLIAFNAKDKISHYDKYEFIGRIKEDTYNKGKVLFVVENILPLTY